MIILFSLLTFFPPFVLLRISTSRFHLFTYLVPMDYISSRWSLLLQVLSMLFLHKPILVPVLLSMGGMLDLVIHLCLLQSKSSTIIVYLVLETIFLLVMIVYKLRLMSCLLLLLLLLSPPLLYKLYILMYEILPPLYQLMDINTILPLLMTILILFESILWNKRVKSLIFSLFSKLK
jgi:hypothetical protein